MFGKTCDAAPVANDGGNVVTLFLMVAGIAFALFQAVTFYASATTVKYPAEAIPKRLLRLLSGWANIGNSVVHVILVIYMKANEETVSEYWAKERELGGIEGPVFLILLNFIAGMLSLRGNGVPRFSIGWNSFVAVLGTLMPIVWPRFLAEGFATWPHIIIFIWFGIYAMELTAVTTSITWSWI